MRVRVSLLPLGVLTACLALGFAASPAQSPREVPPAGHVYLRADSVLGPVGYVVRDGWRYHPGDDRAWARPGFDDTAWPVGGSHLVPTGEGEEGGTEWPGIGWLRLRVTVDSALVGTPLGLHVVQAGASEVYLDGRLLYRLGRVSADPAEEEAFWDQHYPRVITFEERSEHVLAVRYSNASTEASRRVGIGNGFYLIVGDLAGQIEERVEREHSMRGLQVLFTAVPLAFAVLHLFLFLFYRRLRENLYFALLTAAIGASNWVDLEAVFAQNPQELVALLYAEALTSLLSGLLGLRLAHHLRDPQRRRTPRSFWVFAVAGAALWAWTTLVPSTGAMVALMVYHLVILAEILRVVAGSRIAAGPVGVAIAVGLLVSLASMMAQMLVNLGVVPPFTPIPVYYYGVLGLLLTISLLLSSRFARTSRDLEARLAEVEVLTRRTLEQERHAHEAELARRLLEADNDRKTRELEEARRLQLSMLPRSTPTLPYVDVAVYMKTATEVGGDYYDFHVASDGSLTVAIGDATGHGTAAGLVVAAVKGLVTTMAEAEDLRGVFHECTRVLKRMHARPHYMALQLVRIREHEFTVASAGMPYVLVYRAGTGTVEEVVLKGAPLGHVDAFPYEQATRPLGPGDTVLLMSDGLPELFNEAHEMFDYDRARRTFREAAGAPPDDVIAHLAAAVERWSGGRLPNDDVTFVVLRRKGTTTNGAVHADKVGYYGSGVSEA